MEVFLQINSKVDKMVPLLLHDKTKPNKHRAISFKVNSISCRASTELSMPRKKTNLYEVLSLGSENVGFDEIKQAYRRMARRYHPDVCPPSAKEESTKRFVEIREAYETLSDPISRQMHDHELSLVHSNGFGVEGFRIEERENRFPRAVWEMQLNELRRRSRLRMERKRRDACRF